MASAVCEREVVEDVDGNRYLDFMAGIAVASTGYGHPEVCHLYTTDAAEDMKLMY